MHYKCQDIINGNSLKEMLLPSIQSIDIKENKVLFCTEVSEKSELIFGCERHD
jgi:hypothetical protein